MRYAVRVHTGDDTVIPDIYVEGFTAIRKLIVESGKNRNIWMLQFFRPDGMFSKVFIPFQYFTYEECEKHKKYMEEKAEEKSRKANSITMPDAYSCKEYWEECIKSPILAGRDLDKTSTPVVVAQTKKQIDTKRKQQHLLARRTYLVPDISHIKWR